MAAIYGTIAANGIILITTQEKLRQVAYNTYTGFQETKKAKPTECYGVCLC
jgi:hypothetical protein